MQRTITVFIHEDMTQILQKSGKLINCIKHAELLTVLHLETTRNVSQGEV